MVSRTVSSVVSLVFVVGVVICVVSVVHRSGDAKNNQKSSNAMKAVTSFCAHTTYKDVCADSVSSAAKNSSSTTKDFLLSAIASTASQVEKLIEEMNNKTTVDKHIKDSDSYNRMALEECKILLDDGIHQLRASNALVSKTEIHTLTDRVNELLNWLSAVEAYQTTCLDQIENPDFKKDIVTTSDRLSRLTDNAINVVADMSEILNASNTSPPENEKPKKSRRLLQVKEVGDYPSWFPVADRKLLAGDINRQQGGPHATVAKDGSGQYETITEAVKAYTKKEHRGRYIIYVKAGVYDEQVIIDRNQTNVFIYGDGPGKTIVTGNKSYEGMRIPPSMTATFVAKGKGFIAKSMTFRNTAGPAGHRAVALRVQSDESAIFDCSIEGYHDTLQYHALRQFYRNCVISGTVDFIFGMGTAVIQNSMIIVRKPADPGQTNTVTADGKTKQKLNNGLVIQNCRIVPDRELDPDRFKIKTYLGRPWKPQASTVVMQTEIGDFIRPEGWLQWKDKDHHETCSYAEFDNRGPGAGVGARDQSFKNWHVLSQEDAARCTAGPLLEGDTWLNKTGAPFTLGL